MPLISLTIDGNDNVRPCPFCGSGDIELQNTHRACYVVVCLGCDAEVHGESFGVYLKSENLTMRHHKSAKQSALEKWNRRATDEGRP